jgi:hypothetical protein
MPLTERTCAGRQIMAVKHEIDRGRVVSRFFGTCAYASLIHVPGATHLGIYGGVLVVEGTRAGFG